MQGDGFLLQAAPGNIGFENLFQGHLTLAPSALISTDVIQRTYGALTGLRDLRVKIISADRPQDALPFLQEHVVNLTVCQHLLHLFAKELVAGFETLSYSERFANELWDICGRASLEAVQRRLIRPERKPHDAARWVNEVPCASSDMIFEAIHESFFATAFFAFGFDHVYHNDHARAGRFIPLLALMSNTAIPFALADNYSTLLCLAD